MCHKNFIVVCLVYNNNFGNITAIVLYFNDRQKKESKNKTISKSKILVSVVPHLISNTILNKLVQIRFATKTEFA
jgi:hypothetical protein